MPVNHVINETIRLIEEYKLTRQDVKYLLKELNYRTHYRTVRLPEGAADIKP